MVSAGPKPRFWFSVVLTLVSISLGWPAAGRAEPGAEAPVQAFLETHCLECHDAAARKGGLDLEGLSFELSDPANFSRWVTIHDRVKAGEMPPKPKVEQPKQGTEGEPGLSASAVESFTRTLANQLVAQEEANRAAEGRSTLRRLNRYEYENAIRDLLSAPWLPIREGLPEDGEAFRFNKVGEALDISHVQMGRYLTVADEALRRVVASQVERPKRGTVRYHARDQRSFAGKMKFSAFNQRAERATFPVLHSKPQPDIRAGKTRLSVGKEQPEVRDEEAVGVVASTYEPLEIKFSDFKAPAAGRYRLRFSAYSIWVGPGEGKRWYIPNLDEVSVGRRAEPVTVYAETPPRLLRRLGSFDAAPEPDAQVQELDVWLLPGETIRPDAVRLFRSRPPNYHNPLAEEDGCPGVAFRWLEVEGPIHDEWPSAGHKLLFGDLPIKDQPHEKAKGDQLERRPSETATAGVEVVSRNPSQDAKRLLRNFVRHAYRRPVSEAEELRFLPLIERTLESGSSFVDAMITGYAAVLCSPEYLCLFESPGSLDDHAIAARLAFFLGNSAPDEALREAAAKGRLRTPKELEAQTERLLDAPGARRFVEAFLDYWLDLRHIEVAAPDSLLYADYYLDDWLTESALEESRAFFNELLRENLPARNIVSSDFAMLNERLAAHYGLPAVEGSQIRRVELPPESLRGGLMTQASVLKVTANGTTTSPVVRGVWVMERILGQPTPPPPPGIPAVEPDIRGATTIRAQLEKHRSVQACAGCHARIDPAGFALESFDVMGGWRERYRALAESPEKGGPQPTSGIGHNGQKYAFHAGPRVDSSGTLLDGRGFEDVRGLKQLLLADERQVARNLVRQLLIYATGAPPRFADRDEVEGILDRAQEQGYGVRRLIHEIVRSPLFLSK